MGFCLSISLVIHAVLCLALQKTFPIPWIAEPMRTYEVEFLRPPVIDLDGDAETGAEIGPVQEEGDEGLSTDQETISLDTLDQKYVSYAGAIKGKIMKSWQYPPEAKTNLVEGKLKVLFTLTRNGDMERIRILASSGHPVLDQEALRAVRAASPFPPFPGHMTARRLNIDANFEYRLTQKK